LVISSLAGSIYQRDDEMTATLSLMKRAQ